MKKHTNWKFVAVIGALATALNVWSQPTPLYENFGNITAFGEDVPQIDAIAFANYGTFNVITFTPYDTQNTLNFTNRGVMANPGSGFEFDTTSPLGARRSAANFVNHRDAEITAGTHFNIHATNIVNAGHLEVGGSGFLSLKGQKVNLSRGVLYIPSESTAPVSPFFTFPDPDTNFIRFDGITDAYWGGGEQTNTDSRAFSRGGTPFHAATNFGTTSIQYNTNSLLGYAFTNVVGEGTNTTAVIQVALLSLPGTNLTPVVNFEQSPDHNFLRIINMGFSADRTNVLGQIETSYLFMKDGLAVYTNTVMSTNESDLPVLTFRPLSYAITRANLGGFGDTANTPFSFDYIYNTNYVSPIITNLYIAYAANTTDQFVEIPAVPGAGSEDLPGRVTIEAESLNLDHTRIQGETYVKIHTKHLEGSANLAVQSQRLSYGLASTNGTLRVQNLVRSHVPRFFGNVRAYSAYWTNFNQTYVTNTIPDPTDPTITTNEVTTNITPCIIHVAVMSANIATQSEVAVDDLIMYSTNMNVFDTVNVTNGFYASGRNLTIEPSGSINFSAGLNNWRSTNAPAVLNFTNRGGLDVPNNVNLGQDRVTPYTSIVNLGAMSAASFQFKSEVFQNSGDISAGARITFDAVDATLDGGGSQSGGDTIIQGGGVKLRNYELNSGRALYINVDNYLEDSGDGSGNTIVVNDGFHLSKQPAKGNLLGTTFFSTASTFASVNHTWAGSDVGATVAGFTNPAVNVPIGQLQLVTEPNAELVFAGTGSANALYVDLLTLPTEELDELPALLRIADNMTIYFADANISPEELDGQLGGRLRWVSEYAGPLSGMDVLLGNGSVIRVNRVLRESVNIDSDADGIPNGLDDAPFDGVAISSVSITGTASPSAQITWEAAAGTVYTVEFATDILNVNWQPLLNYTNSYSTNITATITDPIAPNSGQRYYRVTYTP